MARESFEHLVESFARSHEITMSELSKVIIGQQDVLQQIFAAVLARGHCLLVGVPGLAKTLIVSSIAQIMDVSFRRIQFTPDLMPSDITGTNVIDEDENGRRNFRFVEGPLFAHIILADEINRTPPKTQAALLEAMQEKRVSSGGEDFKLDEPFFVLATQNPIEQEGTYPLPEAQLDRFLLHVMVGYPHVETERQILHLARGEAKAGRQAEVVNTSKLSVEQLRAARTEVLDLYLADNLEEYLLQLVLATRQPQPYGEDLVGWIQYGASPRASIALDRCSRARAWLAGRDYVSPEDIQTLAFDVLRHRVLLTYEAEADGINVDRLVTELIARVPVP
jgi:MoxR-like ATPase